MTADSSAALPNGFDFWVFADTPRYEFRKKKNKWKLVSFITGSTAGMAKFTPGKPLKKALTEIRPGAQLKSTNQPAQFMKTPVAYMPDGSGKKCIQLHDGRKAFSVRWPVGAALMPDRTNVLIPYAIVCVLNEKDYFAEGWGFALFNYKTQRFTTKPINVIKPNKNGAEMPSAKMYGSPLVVGKKVTFYSWTCCDDDGAVYSTTVSATAAALKKPGVVRFEAGYESSAHVQPARGEEDEVPQEVLDVRPDRRRRSVLDLYGVVAEGPVEGNRFGGLAPLRHRPGALSLDGAASGAEPGRPVDRLVSPGRVRAGHPEGAPVPARAAPACGERVDSVRLLAA